MLEWKIFLYGFFTIIVLAGVFLLGGNHVCQAGNGTLVGLKCTQIEHLGICEDLLGNKYKVNDISLINSTINSSWWES
jgi:hypothetical protein